MVYIQILLVVLSTLSAVASTENGWWKKGKWYDMIWHQRKELVIHGYTKLQKIRKLYKVFIPSRTCKHQYYITSQSLWIILFFLFPNLSHITWLPTCTLSLTTSSQFSFILYKYCVLLISHCFHHFHVFYPYFFNLLFTITPLVQIYLPLFSIFTFRLR